MKASPSILIQRLTYPQVMAIRLWLYANRAACRVLRINLFEPIEPTEQSETPCK
jgi:hypothetical protein